MRIDPINTYYSGRENGAGLETVNKGNQPITGISDEKNDPTIRLEKQQGIEECKTCSQRKYQDQSNDPSVSFQAATHLDPNQAAGAVTSHEQEHVANEQSRASKEGRKVISQTVQIFTDVCPECGRRYVSGGKTKTISKADNSNSAENNLNKKYFGQTIDLKV